MSIYEKHDKHFAGITAAVVLHNGQHVANIKIKRPARGVTVYAYVHWLGTAMTRGRAGGGGYDKEGAAVAGAVRGVKTDDTLRAAFNEALAADNGRRWTYNLADAGFTVLFAL